MSNDQMELVKCTSCDIKTPRWNTCLVESKLWCLHCVVTKRDSQIKFDDYDDACGPEDNDGPKTQTNSDCVD